MSSSVPNRKDIISPARYVVHMRKWFAQSTQLAFYVNLHRSVIGPSATLTGRWRPDIDLRRMLTGNMSSSVPNRKDIISPARYVVHMRKWFAQSTQLAFYVNLHRAVIGPSGTLTGRWRPDIDLRRMLTGYQFWADFWLFFRFILVQKRVLAVVNFSWCLHPEAYNSTSGAMTLKTTYRRKVPHHWLAGFSSDWH